MANFIDNAEGSFEYNAKIGFPVIDARASLLKGEEFVGPVLLFLGLGSLLVWGRCQSLH